MEMDQSTLSRLLRPLEAAGLLDIRVSALDARVRELRATEEGELRFEAATPFWRAAQTRMEALLGPAHGALHTSLAAAVETIKSEDRVG
jgi:DNA-binding MarR family transcriptional regulator